MAEEEKDQNKQSQMNNENEENKEQEERRKENPIDSDKVAENPHTLTYSHHVGGQPIKPVDESKVKGRAVSAMQQQTDQQLGQIRKQMEVLAQQASEIQKRVDVSEKIYDAETSFEPRISHVYHLFERENGNYVLSMISPEDWGKSMPFKSFVASVKLLSDHTWEVLD